MSDVNEPPVYRCFRCLDGRRVCAEHPATAWEEGRGCCGAEGAQYPACNPTGEMPPGFVTLATTEDARGRDQWWAKRRVL